MAYANKVATSLHLQLSLGQEDGKEIMRSVSFSGMDVNADAETLHAAAAALSALLEPQMVGIRKYDTSAIVE